MAVKPITNKQVVSSQGINRAHQTSTRNLTNRSGNRSKSFIPGSSQTGTKAVEVDIKREIAIGKVDTAAVKSEEYKGKVNNKLDKLKKLRKRNGR